MRQRSLVRLALLLAIVTTLSCSGDRVVDAPRILTQYTVFEPSRVMWPRSYYSDATEAHFLFSEYLRFDDTGRMLTRESLVLSHDLVSGTMRSATVTAHMTVQRKGNALMLGAPDACAPRADCTAGRVLRIPETGVLIEAPGRYGSDSLVFGPRSVLISRSE